MHNFQSLHYAAGGSTLTDYLEQAVRSQLQLVACDVITEHTSHSEIHILVSLSIGKGGRRHCKEDCWGTERNRGATSLNSFLLINCNLYFLALVFSARWVQKTILLPVMFCLLIILLLYLFDWGITEISTFSCGRKFKARVYFLSVFSPSAS